MKKLYLASSYQENKRKIEKQNDKIDLKYNWYGIER